MKHVFTSNLINESNPLEANVLRITVLNWPVKCALNALRSYCQVSCLYDGETGETLVYFSVELHNIMLYSLARFRGSSTYHFNLQFSTQQFF